MAHHDETLVFLLDVDNTLLDNDRLKNDLDGRLRMLLGAEEVARFWDVYEEVRRQEDYVDYPATIRLWAKRHGTPQDIEDLERMVDEMDYASYLYPSSLEAIKHLWRFGTVVILSDGDTVFQPMKIRASGLQEAVHDNVLIYIHKERESEDVFARFPADYYVMVDDKPRILAALERDCPVRFTTVLVMQGKYSVVDKYRPLPDYTVPDIGALRKFSRRQLLHPQEVKGILDRSPSLG